MRREPIIEVYDGFRRAGFSVGQAVPALAREGISLYQLLDACHRRLLQVPSDEDQDRFDELRRHAEGLGR